MLCIEGHPWARAGCIPLPVLRVGRAGHAPDLVPAELVVTAAAAAVSCIQKEG
jgi:hypothetical protein